VSGAAWAILNRLDMEQCGRKSGVAVVAVVVGVAGLVEKNNKAKKGRERSRSLKIQRFRIVFCCVSKV